VEVFAGVSGIKVYELRDALPRAWTVHNVIAAASKRDIAAHIQNPDFDFRTTAAMTGTPPVLTSCQDDPAPRWLARSANTMEWEVTMSCRGMLVVSDTWAPGWKATVDRLPVEVHEVYGMLRGVVVPEGTHKVRMSYAPKSVFVGAWLTLLGLMMPLLVSRGEQGASRQ
jgi:hypothetical protein